MENEVYVLWTVDAQCVPQVEQRVLVVVDGDAGLGQLGVEQLPQVHEVGLEHALLRLGEQAVRQSLEKIFILVYT